MKPDDESGFCILNILFCILYTMSQSLYTALLDVCHLLADRGFVSATDGNVSARLPGETILITRTSINKGMVTEGDIIEVDRNGKVLNGVFPPSTEMNMHLCIYEERPEIHAVVHAHPVHATAFAAAGQSIEECVFPEVVLGFGGIPLASYATPSTREVRESLAPFIHSHDAILLANHGVVTYGTDPWDVFFKMEKVEQTAHILFVARLLGGERVLTSDAIEKLCAISKEHYGIDMDSRRFSAPAQHMRTYTEEEVRSIVRKVIDHLNENNSLKKE